MVPLSIGTKLQNMNKFQDGSILHLVKLCRFQLTCTEFASWQSYLLTNKTAIKKKETNRQHRISKPMFEINSENLDLKFSLVILF